MTRMFAGLRMPRRRGIGIAGAALLCVLISTVAIVNPLGLSRVHAATSAQATINASQSLGSLTNTSEGLNTAIWDGQMLDSASTTAVKNAGVAVLRYPGGSASDVYHWQSHSEDNGGFVNSSDTFDAFMGVAQSSGAQAMITVNY